MQLSIIIPSYNRAHTLKRALDSVFAQHNLAEFESEVIVVDDGSSDTTAQLIRQHYPQVVYLRQDNLGVSAARNHGLRESSADWLAFLDSDDQWLPHKLQRQFDLLEQSDAVVCHTEEQWIRNGKRVNQMKKHQKQGGQIFEQCLALCAMSPSSIIINRQVLQQVGNFDESLPACEDYDLWLRICARFEVAYVEQACINKYGGHADQLSRQHWGMDRFRVIALQNLLQDDSAEPFLASSQRELALQTLLNKLQILRNGAKKRDNQTLVDYCDDLLSRWQAAANIRASK